MGETSVFVAREVANLLHETADKYHLIACLDLHRTPFALLY